ncbi:hypothetical protein [Nocardia sp. NPDC003979]
MLVIRGGIMTLATIVGLLLMVPAAAAAGCGAIVISYWLKLHHDRQSHQFARDSSLQKSSSQSESSAS